MNPFLPAVAGFPPCPSCGTTADPLPILYGFPDQEAVEAAERGEAVLGGCLVGDESPELACPTCQAPLPWVIGAGER